MNKTGLNKGIEKNMLANESEGLLDKRFPGYRLISLLSQSGESLVYKAIHKNTERMVAIKTPIVKLTDNENIYRNRLSMFEKEMAMHAKLHHPNIVQLIDKGNVNEIPYAVFEFIPGVSLKDKLRDERRLEAREALRLMMQVLDALQCIHSHGIVHRDLKPQNILLSQTGLLLHCKLLDFDAADDVNKMSTSSTGAYTASYAAPEILRGEMVSAQADYYSWGLIFAECLTGQQLVGGHVEQMQTSNLELPLPAVLHGSSIAPVIQKAIRKKAKDRYQRISDIVEDLHSLKLSELYIRPDKYVDQPILSFMGNTESGNNGDETKTDTPIYFNHHYKERKSLSILCVNLHYGRLPEVRSPIDIERVEQLYDAFVHKLQHELFFDDTEPGFGHLGSTGDLLLFQFGYPVASDNDSRLAARLALDMMAEYRHYHQKFRQLGCLLKMKIGLHRGGVNLDACWKPSGNTINTAVELTRHSVSGEIVCTQSIQQCLKNYYHFGHAAFSHPGFAAEPERIFTLKSEQHSEATGFLRGKRSQYKLIGREKELSLLRQQFTNGAASQPKRAYLFGEAGIGKSCLVFELMDQLNGYDHSIIQCLPEIKHDALAAILNLIKRMFSLDEMDDEQAQYIVLSCLERNANTQYQHSHIAAILGDRLDINVSPLTGMPPPEQYKLILFEGLAAMLAGQSDSDKSKLFIFEDIHWADVTSLEFLAYFSAQERFCHHALLCTSRQDIPDAIKEANFVEQPINKLNAEQVALLASILFDGASVSDKVLMSITSRADGIPLFVEELIDMFKNKQWVEKINNEVVFAQTMDSQQIPNTLRELLQHKLDTLTHGKGSAQLAATIGREFDRSLLEQVSNRTTKQIQYDINELIRCSLIVPQRKAQTEAYLFRHALVRDVAYQSMPETHRQSAHHVVACTIENTQDTDDFSVIASLSQHFFHSNNYEKSSRYSKIAAERAISVNEHQQAIHYADIAFMALEQLPDSIEQQLDLSQILTTSKMMTCGWASSETEQQIITSQRLLEKLGKQDIAHHFSTCWSTATYYNVVGNGNEVLRLTSSALNTQAYSQGEQAALYALRAHTYYLQGAFKQAVDEANAALSRYNPKQHKDHAAKYGHDTKVLACNVQVLAYGMLGDYQSALHVSSQAGAYAIELDNPHSRCMGLVYRSCLYYMQKTAELIPSLHLQISEICKKHQLSNWPILSDILNAWSLGDVDLIGHKINALVAAGATQGLGFWQAMQAESLLSAGKYSAVIELAKFAIKGSEQRNEQGFVPELEFALGKSYLALGDITCAEKYITKALGKASEKSMMGLLEQINQTAIYH